MNRKLLIAGALTIVVLIAGGAVAYKIYHKVPATLTNSFPVVKVDKGDVEKIVFAQGAIGETEREEVTAELAGVVDEIFVEVGDRVRAGDLLFTMDDTESKIALTQANINLQRRKAETQKAEASVKTDRVYATAVGNLSKCYVKVGDPVTENTVIAEISNPDIREVTTAFSPIDVDKIKSGMKARIFLLDNLTYVDGVVTEVDRKGQTDKSGGIIHNVSIRFSNPGGVATGGQASASFLLPGGQRIESVLQAEIREGEPVKVKAECRGVVSNIIAREGDYLTPKSIIARIDISDALDTVKMSRLAVKDAELGLELKKKEAGKFQVRAGQDGVVTEVNVVKGKKPPGDKPAAIISGAKGLELKALVDEEDFPFLKTGQKATVYVKAFGDRKFQGIVSSISKEGKNEGGKVTFETKIRLTKPETLAAGMTGDADIAVEKKTGVLRLPITSVLIDGSHGRVLKPAAGGPKNSTINLGLEGDEYVEITGGLRLGDQVLLNPVLAR